MATCITIPTGDRTESALAVAKAWKALGFKVCAYAWDDETYNALFGIADKLLNGCRKPFAMLQNFMIDEIILDSEAVICGADDLYPGVNCEKIPGYVEKNQGKALHIFDGVNPVQPTHPVLTRKFIENNSPVFDERFVHNFCDTDLYKRHKKDFVKINDVFFDHRHWINSQREKDNIDEIANASFELDRTYYLQKHGNLTL